MSNDMLVTGNLYVVGDANTGDTNITNLNALNILNGIDGPNEYILGNATAGSAEWKTLPAKSMEGSIVVYTNLNVTTNTNYRMVQQNGGFTRYCKLPAGEIGSNMIIGKRSNSGTKSIRSPNNTTIVSFPTSPTNHLALCICATPGHWSWWYPDGMT